MADADIEFANSTTEGTATGATFTDGASLSTLTGSTEYIIIGTLATKGSAGTTDRGGRLVYGATPTVFGDAYGQYDPVGSDERWPHGGWMYRFTTASSPETIKTQFNLAEGSGTITHQLSQILAIATSDLGTEDTHWFWNEDETNTTDAASFTSRTSVTFSPSGSDVWLVMGYVSWLEGTASGVNFGAELYESGGSTVKAQTTWTGQDSTGDNFTLLVGFAEQLSSGSKTFQLRTKSNTSQTIARVALLAINLSNLADDVQVAYASGTEDPAASPSWTTTRTLSVTPSQTGDYVILAFASGNATSAAAMYTRLQVDGSSNPAYGDDAPDNQGGGASPAASAPWWFINKVNLSTSTHTINFDWQNADTSTIGYRTLVAFSVLKASTGTTISPPVISNTATIYTPTARTTKVYAPVITNTATIYTPSVKRAVAVPLIALTVTLYAPTVHTTKVNAPVITQTATIYTPTVHTTKVNAPVITQTATIYTPAVSRKAAVPVITQTAVQYTPAVAFRVYAPAIDDTAIIYTPEVQEAGAEQAEPPLIDQTAVIYTPAVKRAVAVPAIDQTAVIYTPTVTPLYSPPLIAQTATLYTPAVHTTKVYAPFIDDTAIIYTPAAEAGATAAPPLIDQTATIYTPKALVGSVFQVNVNSGAVDCFSTDYGNARVGVGSFSFSTAVGQYKSGSTYHVIEGFIAFDTSSISDTAYITEVTLWVAAADSSTTNDFALRAGVRSWLSGGLTTSDFVSGSSLSGLTEVASKSTTLWDDGQYNSLTSDDDFKTNVSLTGNTELLLWSSRQQSAIAPTGSEYLNLDWSSDEQPPFLVVAWHAGVYPPVITQTAQVYTPSVHTTKVTAPFIDQTAQVYEPTVTPLYAPPLIVQTVVVYTPTVSLAVAPAFLDYSATIYTPSVAPVLYPPLITLTVQVYEPQVLFPGPLTLTVPLIDVEPILYQPQVHRFDPTQHQHRLRLRSERAGTVF